MLSSSFLKMEGKASFICKKMEMYDTCLLLALVYKIGFIFLKAKLKYVTFLYQQASSITERNGTRPTHVSRLIEQFSRVPNSITGGNGLSSGKTLSLLCSLKRYCCLCVVSCFEEKDQKVN